jgi:branched-chain amino acid transport system ATP-binding protein
MLLQVKNLRCGYGSLEVVHGASLHVCTGEIVGLLGANGAGKSSLLKAIVGLLEPWSGEVLIDGRPTTGQPAWRSISNSTMLVPEGKMIFADMTVRENLLIGGYHNPDRAMQMDIVLERFPRLRERLHQLGGTLSGGEQQMLAIGRALMARPRLLLLDEPSMGLAPLLVKEVFAEVQKMKDLGLTVLLVEQNATATLQIADRAYVMETGEILQEGAAADLAHNPEVKRAYLGKGGRGPSASGGQEGGGGNPKAEIRRPKEARSPKSEGAEPRSLDAAQSGAEAGSPQPSGSTPSRGGEVGGEFGLRISDFLRTSAFGFRIWRQDSAGNAPTPRPPAPLPSLA